MESKKQASPETSSEEGDQAAMILEELGSVKRSYKCIYCKRGFTNAQALGGHMNIHRKDRAKDKQQSLSYSVSASRSCAVSVISTQPEKYYPVFEAQQNYHMHIHPPNPRFSHVTRSKPLKTKEELFAANLSLKIGSSPEDDIDMKRVFEKEGDEIDLELRLGHNPK